VYRLADDGTLTVLVDDLPAGAGLWTGGLAIGADRRLYVGTGAACNACAGADPGRGAIFSLALTGGERRLVARGLRYPGALLAHSGVLWATDTAPTLPALRPGLDELNRIEPGGDYGFPRCAADGLPVGPDSAGDCAATVPPVLRLPTESLPVGLALYEGAAFPHLRGRLLLALAGADNRYEPVGFSLLALDVASLGTDLVRSETLLPYDRAITGGSGAVYSPPTGLSDVDAMFINRRGAGVYPHRLYGLAVDGRGWIYLSVGGGAIAVLRPL
jgi:glucose/arabinose dehydrogenase